MNNKFTNLVFKHSQIFIYVFVFLLLFLNGTRLDNLWALTIALTDTLFFIVSYQIFCYLLTKTPRWLNHDVIKFLFIVLVIGLLSHSLYWFEYLIIKFVSFNIEPPKSELIPYLNLYRFMKGLILTVVALCVAIYKYATLSAIRAKELKQESDTMRLQLLQSRINPHFLFNALNNIYALVYTKNEKAPDALMKLSEMLRYVTDYGQDEKVLVTKDVDYIKNYVDFQKLRVGECNRLVFSCQMDAQNHHIVPMLLQPFVENCFVHSDLTSNKDGFIHIFIELKNGVLHFQTENTVSKVQRPNDNRPKPVGLDNVEQRLKLYYNNDFQLFVAEKDSVHSVDLTIKL